VEELTPVEISEAPWLDPWDGLWSGAYRVRLPHQPAKTADHLVVYLRRRADDPTDAYTAPTTVCGEDLEGAVRPRRITGDCRACVDGVVAAFQRARMDPTEHVEAVE
jgi:hypothetical protein